MRLRRSPTLQLAASVEAALARGERAFSLSTPTFIDRTRELDIDGNATRLSPPMGLAELRLAARAALLGKWTLPEHEIMVTAGAKAAIFSALRASCGAGDRVLIVGPHWPSYEDLAQLLFLEPVSLECRFSDGFTLDMKRVTEALDASGARAVLLSNPNNPTGRIHSARELTELSMAARARSALLLIDESFSGVIFDHEKWRASLCPFYERLVVVSSFSKSHQLQGLRVGVACVHTALLEDVLAAHQALTSAAPSLSQAAVMAFLERQGEPVDYREQREAALDFVHAQGWPCVTAEGSFYLFPQVPDFEAFANRARASNVYLLPGTAFGEAYRGHLRLCFGKPMEELGAMFSTLGDARSS